MGWCVPWVVAWTSAGRLVAPRQETRALTPQSKSSRAWHVICEHHISPGNDHPSPACARLSLVSLSPLPITLFPLFPLSCSPPLSCLLRGLLTVSRAFVLYFFFFFATNASSMLLHLYFVFVSLCYPLLPLLCGLLTATSAFFLYFYLASIYSLLHICLLLAHNALSLSHGCLLSNLYCVAF